MEKVKVRPSIRSTLPVTPIMFGLVRVQLTLMMEFKSLVPLAGFSTDFVPVTTADGLWGLNAQGVQFSSVGNITYNLTGGLDYQEGGGMTN